MIKKIDIFRYGKTKKQPGPYEMWFVVNVTTRKRVICSCESACLKIIKNAIAELNEQESPYKTATLEYKAGYLLD